jgi:hypothetical protein
MNAKDVSQPSSNIPSDYIAWRLSPYQSVKIHSKQIDVNKVIL